MAQAKPVSGIVDDRDIATAAWKLKMTDATMPEIVRVCFLMLQPGMTIARAKEIVIGGRNDIDPAGVNIMISVRIPEEDIEAAQANAPTPANAPALTSSQLLRYAIARRIDDEQDALERATSLKQGGARPGAGRPRGSKDAHQ